MTVEELHNSLTGVMKRAVVVVDGYEGGLEEALSATPIRAHLDEHKEIYYFGPHKRCSGSDCVCCKEGDVPVDALYLARRG